MDALNSWMVDLLDNQYNVAQVASGNTSNTATPLRHDSTLTKNRSDVSRPTDAFPTSWLPTLSPRVTPMCLVLRTCFTTSAWGDRYVFATSSMPRCSIVRLSIAYFTWGRLFTCLISLFIYKTFINHSKGSVSSWRYTTDTCSDVSRPSDVFHNICKGGQTCIHNIVDAKLLNCVSTSPISRGGDCLSSWYLRITLHTLYCSKCFCPSPISHGGREWLSVSLHRLFRMGESDYPDDNLWFFLCLLLPSGTTLTSMGESD